MRLLLQNTGIPGIWIAASPDMEVSRLDRNAHCVVPLKGGAQIPPDDGGNYSYCIGSPIDPVDHARARAEFSEMLHLLGLSSSSAGPEGSTWRWADTGDANFGARHPQA